jgi:hypothetical protein
VLDGDPGGDELDISVDRDPRRNVAVAGRALELLRGARLLEPEGRRRESPGPLRARGIIRCDRSQASRLSPVASAVSQWLRPGAQL